jgi:hypothetical protein
LQRGLLPRPPFLGSATHYQRRQLIWLLAIRRRLVTDKLTLEQSRTRLKALSPAEIETFATELLRPGAIADALGVRPPAGGEDGAVGSGAESTGGAIAAGPLPRWPRVELALGSPH